MRMLLVLLLVAGVALSKGVPFRVVASNPVVIDRGESDGLAIGDRLLLVLRDGGTRAGAVVEVAERSAVVELDDRAFLPEPGTRGEVRVPAERLEAPEPPEPSSTPSHPEWQNEDEGWTPDRPPESASSTPVASSCSGATSTLRRRSPSSWRSSTSWFPARSCSPSIRRAAPSAGSSRGSDGLPAPSSYASAATTPSSFSLA